VSENVLYSTSPGLKAAIRSRAAVMVAGVATPLALVEYIVLPEFGQRVILRFGPVGDQKLSFAQADALETALRRLAGGDYWAALTGDFYAEALPDLGQLLIRIEQKIPADVLRYLPTPHTLPILADARTIRAALGLGDGEQVWEIEVGMSAHPAETVIRVTGAPQPGAPARVSIGADDCAVEYMPAGPSFAGCVKAYLMAERKQMALNSYITQETQNQDSKGFGNL
jgi:hypothetical protein